MLRRWCSSDISLRAVIVWPTSVSPVLVSKHVAQQQWVCFKVGFATKRKGRLKKKKKHLWEAQTTVPVDRLIFLFFLFFLNFTTKTFFVCLDFCFFSSRDKAKGPSAQQTIGQITGCSTYFNPTNYSMQLWVCKSLQTHQQSQHQTGTFCVIWEIHSRGFYLAAFVFSLSLTGTENSSFTAYKLNEDASHLWSLTSLWLLYTIFMCFSLTYCVFVLRCCWKCGGERFSLMITRRIWETACVYKSCSEGCRLTGNIYTIQQFVSFRLQHIWIDPRSKTLK